MIENCLVCGTKLHRSKQHGKNSSTKRRIGENQVTCGGNCGKTYHKISRYFFRKRRQKTAREKP